jgi:lipid II:glycine glycyltransferase (peptidoglycan interpeptide bridge formation enzyme)
VKGKCINIKNAELAICDTADSFLQSAMWGRFKSRFGWVAQAFTVEWNQGGERPLLVLSRRLAPGFSITYVPHGPELPAALPADSSRRASAVAELAQGLCPLLPKSTTFIRFDPPWFAADGSFPPELSTPFKRAAAGIQPPDTVLVDLTPPEENILAAMKSKWRYNIVLAGKRGVTVSEAGEQGLEVFYRLLTETAARDGIAVHSAGYYRALFEECENTGVSRLRLYTAVHEGDVLAALVALFRGKQAVYLYGASSDKKRNVMAPYALQWQAMRDAKASGCTEYDLFGIPPDENPNHPMAGLYRFKTGFGGAIIHRPGSWDFPRKPLPYSLFSAAERLRKKAMDRRKRRGGN